MLGKTIDGKYQIVRLLGQGGMGAVYEAAHSGTGRRVALKVIVAETISRDAILRFQREARAAGVIESQHIVQVLDTGIDRELGMPFMVMEYLVGEDLQKLGERIGALSADLALRVAAQVCSGLHKAHEAQVVHRDIKPANIYLSRRDDEDVVVKLLDFGIAKVKEEQLSGGADQVLTRTGSMMGSPLYMSPEQAMGLKTIDHRTDVWSLGAVLYEVLAGKTPHHGAETLGQLILAICSTPPVHIQRIAPVSDEVAAIVHRALRLEPNERFQSAAEMRDAIRRLLPQGSNLTQAMLVADSPANSVASLQPQALATGGAVAGKTGDPFSRTAHKPRDSKAPLLVFGLAVGATLGGGGLWLTLRAPTDAAAAASASASAPPPTFPAAATQPALPTAEPASARPAPPALSGSVLPVPAPANGRLASTNRAAALAPAPSNSAPTSAPAAGVSPSPAAVASPAVATPAKPPAPKSTGLTVDRNFE